MAGHPAPRLLSRQGPPKTSPPAPPRQAVQGCNAEVTVKRSPWGIQTHAVGGPPVGRQTHAFGRSPPPRWADGLQVQRSRVTVCPL